MPMAPAPAMTMDRGRSSARICSSYVTTRSLRRVPGSNLGVAPVAMMQWSKRTVREEPSLPATWRVCGSRKVPRPSISVIWFFFIR
ncbi:hypothetical protein MBT84_43725 [Streptomyces sp. MBT84]|nr:hypothetical protein [Streptomyces sp. MBT84]